jgi:hypothetical protein
MTPEKAIVFQNFFCDFIAPIIKLEFRKSDKPSVSRTFIDDLKRIFNKKEGVNNNRNINRRLNVKERLQETTVDDMMIDYKTTLENAISKFTLAVNLLKDAIRKIKAENKSMSEKYAQRVNPSSEETEDFKKRKAHYIASIELLIKGKATPDTFATIDQLRDINQLVSIGGLNKMEQFLEEAYATYDTFMSDISLLTPVFKSNGGKFTRVAGGGSGKKIKTLKLKNKSNNPKKTIKKIDNSKKQNPKGKTQKVKSKK